LDTRFASVEALKSFCSSAGQLLGKKEHIPLLMALYDALNDDDDEVRDIAAAATAGVLGCAVAPLEAADRLLDWLEARYRQLPEFQNIVVCRLAGVSPQLERWPDARVAFDQAANFDESLFAKEEHNLFIDEIRELRRFQRVARAIPWKPEDECLNNLTRWAADGLAVVKETTLRDDGPLGPTSDQHYFAHCARHIVSGVVLSGTSGTALGKYFDVKIALAAVRRQGRETDFHGSLLAMTEEALS
jgi:hypothetical protein